MPDKVGYEDGWPENRYDTWMYLFRNIQDLIDRPEFFDEKEFKRLFTLARIGNFTTQEKEEYMNTFKQCDYYNVIRTAEEEAREKGLAEGRAEGRAEGKAEGRAEATRTIALKLISTGMPIEQIAEIIGVPVAELQGIQ